MIIVRPRSVGGFTLIEVLVALVIVAFGVGALMSTLTSAAESAVVMRDKTFAQWIALNRVSELRLRPPPLTTGKTTGEVEYANQSWQWTATVQDTGLADLVRIDVEVGRKVAGNGEMQQIASATGFIGKAIGPRNGGMPDWSGDQYQSTGQANAKQQEQQNPTSPTAPGGSPPATPVTPPLNNPAARE